MIDINVLKMMNLPEGSPNQKTCYFQQNNNNNNIKNKKIKNKNFFFSPTKEQCDKY